MNKITNFPMLMLSLIGIAIAIYVFLLAPIEKQSATVDVIETAQLATETVSPAIYNEDASSSPPVVNTPSEVESQMEPENQELEEQYPSEDEVMLTPSGGDW